MLVTLDIIILAFVICFCLLVLGGITLDIYLNALFSITILDLFTNVGVLLIAFIGQIVVVGGLSLWIAYSFTHALHKKMPIE